MKTLGVDIGSTTIKCVVLSENSEVLYKQYERHKSCIIDKLVTLLETIKENFDDEEFLISFSGSAGMGIAEELSIPFIQEVFATRSAVKALEKDTDCVIELGGEDAKILFLKGTEEVRMNGSCAGGTGAFIDQMATLLGVTTTELNTLSHSADKIYTIASRCGVFAKSDIQPLLNQGASKSNVAASIFYSVVNQTITGLAQSREIEGNILYLGGPLTFNDYLRSAFDDKLKTTGKCPELSLFFVSYGAAISSKEVFNISDLILKAKTKNSKRSLLTLPPLFKNDEEREEFTSRHSHDSDNIKYIDKPEGKMYLGVDAGSTTVKALLINEKGEIFNPLYVSSKGNPVDIIYNYLKDLYARYPELEIASSASTGYGEEIIKEAFTLDWGIVETIAHYTAAKTFNKDVDFIIDIGGQDIKCFHISNGTIDSIFLNEACSSGCGSFLESFSSVMGYSAKEFSTLALESKEPVDLGSRCTVFMNSSVKQAQKDDVSVPDIAAGLSISVIKNALYKVIRTPDPTKLGSHIVVQGGTFLSDAVLRAFEKETGKKAIRPNIAGLMGAYGAAMYSLEKSKKRGITTSKIITKETLGHFYHKVQALSCKGCSNHCQLTLNDFGSSKRFIAGARCGKPSGKKNDADSLNLFAFKQNELKKYITNCRVEGKKNIAFPLGLNMYELLPFWVTFWRELGYNTMVSSVSSHEKYLMGEHTIPSDTICYPAKLVHGQIEELLALNPDIIFYPSMTYNVDEKKGQNHYNCPIVAYYPDVIEKNVKFGSIEFDHSYLSLSDREAFPKYFMKAEEEKGRDFKLIDVKRASEKAFKELDNYHTKVIDEGKRIVMEAEKRNMPVICLLTRPYHVDGEINHGIDKLITSLGAAVITEDSIAASVKPFKTTMLNQWTYHARLFSAAKAVAKSNKKNLNCVQLVSFGCGIDAITSDEVRAILESKGKIYTQIKIDEITNLGAIKIRLRSLFSVLEG